MFLRSIGSGICVVALLLTSCATSGGLPAVALDFFIPASSENPWNHKIENWQLRHQLDPVVRGADSGPATDLGDAYVSFTDKLRRQIAHDVPLWSAFVRQKAERFGYPYIDMIGDFPSRLREADAALTACAVPEKRDTS